MSTRRLRTLSDFMREGANIEVECLCKRKGVLSPRILADQGCKQQLDRLWFVCVVCLTRCRVYGPTYAKPTRVPDDREIKRLRGARRG